MKIAKDLRHLKGLAFELLGCVYLLIKGYRILKWNYKIKSTAQVDIVTEKNGIIYIVEVKYRKKMTDSIEAIGFNQQQRLKYSAEVIASKYKKTVIIDGLYFSLDRPFVCHKKNIF